MKIKFAIFFILLILILPSFGEAKEKEKEKSSGSPTNLTYLILSGQYQAALDQLPSFKKIKGDWKNRLLFMQAYLTYQKGDDKKAAQLFNDLGEGYKVMQDYVDYYRALALRESGEAKAAIALLSQLKTQGASPALAGKLDRDLAVSYCKAGDRGKAIELFNGLIQTESSNIKAYHLQYDRSQCLIELNAPGEAVATLRTLYLNYPEGDLSEEIRKTLEKIGKAQVLTPADLIQRGDQLMRNSRPALAAVDYAAAMTQAPSPALKLKLADAYFDSRQYPQAAHLFEQLHHEAPSLLDEKELLRLAQSLARSDQFDRALQAYQNLAASAGPSEQATWDFKIAFLHMDKGDYAEANRRFEALLQSYPHYPNRDQVLWYLAWNNQLMKNYDQAQNYLNRLIEEYPGSRWAERAPYWRARILEKQGKGPEARTDFAAIAEKDPFSYYGFLSLKRLDGNWNPPEPPKNSWAAHIPHRSVPQSFNLNALDSQSHKQVARVKELLWLGMWEDFLGELGQLTSGEEVPHDLQNLKQRVQNSPPESATVNGEELEDSYPPAYPTLVSLFSKSREFPMALTWAVMREESRFRADAESPAQAIGLMQIIPPTGAEIAKDLGRQSFVPEQLYQPVTNIEFGVHYLSKNRARFKGDLPETIASYNAGPDAVERWLKARPGREWDEFIEEIPYSETNLYVKKVLKSYYIYKLMYE